jgi:hypothetical protein
MRSEVVYATPADERNQRVSPDGRYLACFSNQSGRDEATSRLPGVIGERQLSFQIAINSRGPLAWSRRRPVLYFLGPGGVLYSVPVVTSPELRIGKPTRVPGGPATITRIEAAPDCRLLLLYAVQSSGAPLTLVENWAARSGTR